MTPVLAAFVVITGLFAILLLAKRLAKKEFCVLCASVSGTWIVLLILHWLGVFEDPVLVALLMGQSVVGVYYLLEKRVSERFLAFRLPFLLSATFGAHVLVAGGSDFLYPLLFLAELWLLFGALFALRANKQAGEVFRRLLACCKNW